MSNLDINLCVKMYGEEIIDMLFLLNKKELKDEEYIERMKQKTLVLSTILDEIEPEQKINEEAHESVLAIFDRLYRGIVINIKPAKETEEEVEGLLEKLSKRCNKTKEHKVNRLEKCLVIKHRQKH